MHFHVVEQDPAPGASVSMFSTVRLVLVAPGYWMPNVVGMAEMDAGQIIDWNGMTQVRIYETTADSADWGLVIAQEPDPGALWGHEPPVTLVIGQQGPVTTVPSISPSTTTTTVPAAHRGG